LSGATDEYYFTWKREVIDVTHTPAEDRDDREKRLMKQGRRRYISELRKQIGQLQEWSREPEPGKEAITAKAFYRVVHTLKGSAPMFGFTQVGSIAQKLVLEWEWAQEAAAGVPNEAHRMQFAACVGVSRQPLRELELELDICVRELELDAYHEHRQQSAAPPRGERLLVIDDDEALRSYLVRRLKLDGYEVDAAADISTAEKLLREHPYHLITLDLMVYPSSGYELFEFLKADPTLKYIPLIVLSGRNDVNDKVRCFYLGADDYVTKPFQFEELSARIYSILKRSRYFEQMAFRDPLTGVYNRRFFDHQIQVELQRVHHYPAPISMVFIDTDRFKSINDMFGHNIGDLVLQGLAHLLQSNLRTTDLLARFGGEEFVIVLPNTSGAEAKKMIEHILEQTHLGPVAQNEGQSFHITFSAGVSEWHNGYPVEEWIRSSDSAMYEAKQGGRNRVVLHSGSAAAPSAGGESKASIGRKVMIADDDHILRSILIAKLKHLPVDIVVAVDGEEAYQTLLKQPFDLCILDGVMPKLDGYGLLERLQGMGLRPASKILILSGRSRDEDISRGLQLGADAYMHKPFSMVELELKVRELLGLTTNPLNPPY
jgi:two-component system cell cycle response regulator